MMPSRELLVRRLATALMLPVLASACVPVNPGVVGGIVGASAASGLFAQPPVDPVAQTAETLRQHFIRPVTPAELLRPTLVKLRDDVANDLAVEFDAKSARVACREDAVTLPVPTSSADLAASLRRTERLVDACLTDPTYAGVGRFEYAAMQAMLEGLDPNASFEGKLDDAKDVTDRVGVWIEKEHRTVTIYRVLDESPAEHAGVRKGEQLLAIDGVRTDREPFFPLAERLNGAPATPISLTVAPGGVAAGRDVTFERRDFPSQEVVSRALSQPVVYVSVARIGPHAGESVRSIAEAARERRAAVVLDVRDTSGGDAGGALRVASLFLPEDAHMLTMRSRPDSHSKHPTGMTRYSARFEQPILDVPLAVLTTAGTKGGGEVLAAVLQDNRRATIVGETTRGKTAVTSRYLVGDRLAISFTTGVIHRRSGNDLALEPVVPDVVVPSGTGPGDAQLDETIRFLTRGAPPNP
jgi:C-terminal peptidase prc